MHDMPAPPKTCMKQSRDPNSKGPSSRAAPNTDRIPDHVHHMLCAYKERRNLMEYPPGIATWESQDKALHEDVRRTQAPEVVLSLPPSRSIVVIIAPFDENEVSNGSLACSQRNGSSKQARSPTSRCT